MIHQYKLLSYNIVLDVCSGAVHAVDEVAYDIIAELNGAPVGTDLKSESLKGEIIAKIGAKYKEREDITAAVAKGNVAGTQFHPEKSGEVGLSILRAFAEW